VRLKEKEKKRREEGVIVSLSLEQGSQRSVSKIKSSRHDAVGSVTAPPAIRLGRSPDTITDIQPPSMVFSKEI